MFSLSPRPRFFLYVGATDMRKGFDALSGLVRNQMQSDPLSGDVFVFVNRARTQIRLLYFDGDGFVIVAKRLEQGTFAVAADDAGSTTSSRVLERGDLLLMLEGIDRLQTRRRVRYARP
jgi:transposase